METPTLTVEETIVLTRTTPCGVHVGTTIEAYANNAAELARMMIGPMTSCCKAAIKDASDGTWRCKACWSEQPSYLAKIGHIALVDAAKDAGCPIPEECATEAIWWMNHLIDEALR